jgi:hypothetical protein
MTSALLAMIAKRKAQFSRVKTIKPAEGRNRYRILGSWRKIENAPTGFTPEQSAEWVEQFFHDFGQHFLKDAAGAIKAVYVCADKTFGRPCQICNELARAVDHTSDDMQLKRIEDASANGRIVMNVLHLDGPTPTEPQILEVAPTVLQGKKGVGGLLSLFEDWPNMLALTPGEGACDIIIERGGKGLDTTYGVSAVPSQTTVTAAQMAKVQNLDNFVMQESTDGAQRAIAAVSSITGLLPAPSAPTLAQAVASSAFEEVPTTICGTVAPVTGTVDAPTTVAVQVAMPLPTAAQTAQPQPVAAVTAPVEADLEELLKGLV